MEGAKWQAKGAPGRQRRSSSEPGQRAFASRGNDCAPTVVVQRRYLVSARDHRARPPAKPTQGPGHGGPSLWQTVSKCCPKGHHFRAQSRKWCRLSWSGEAGFLSQVLSCWPSDGCVRCGVRSCRELCCGAEGVDGFAV